MNNKQRGDLFKVIQKIVSKYESNLKKEYVFKPLSKTLYDVWEETNRKEKKREDGKETASVMFLDGEVYTSTIDSPYKNKKKTKEKNNES